MANGDDAAAAGYALVAGTDDRRNGWDMINRVADYVARLGTELRGNVPAHTHLSADVTDATASATGGTICKRTSTGVISVGEPTAGSHAATRSYVDSKLSGGSSSQANGPTDAAYARSATGSGWYQTWMNSSNQFMRNTSSKRYKKNIRTIAPASALDDILSLRPVFYESRDDAQAGVVHVGLIAEEVVNVLPEVVVMEDGQPEAVNYQFIVAPLIAAIQELTARVAQLERQRTP